MYRQIRRGGKAAVPVHLNVFTGMLILLPGRMRRRVMHAQIEGIVLRPEFFQIRQCFVSNHIGNISVFKADFTIFHNIRLIVVTAASADGKPFIKPVLRHHAIAQMPFPGKGAGISVFLKHIRIGQHPLQILDGFFLTKIIRILPDFLLQAVPIQIAGADPVLYAVRGRNSPCQQAGPGRRADRGSAEEVFKPIPL